MNKRLERILESVTSHRRKVGEPATCTLVYNRVHGTVYEVGELGPTMHSVRVMEKPNVTQVEILYDTERMCAIGELVNPDSVRITRALKRALDQVEEYRSQVQLAHH